MTVYYPGVSELISNMNGRQGIPILEINITSLNGFPFKSPLTYFNKEVIQ